MARLIDLDAKIIVPIVDETQGGMVYEAQMTVAELFARFLPDYTPEVVDAIPLEWIQAQVGNEKRAPLFRRYAEALLIIWQHEQEAQDG